MSPGGWRRCVVEGFERRASHEDKMINYDNADTYESSQYHGMRITTCALSRRDADPDYLHELQFALNSERTEARIWLYYDEYYAARKGIPNNTYTGWIDYEMGNQIQSDFDPRNVEKPGFGWLSLNWGQTRELKADTYAQRVLLQPSLWSRNRPESSIVLSSNVETVDNSSGSHVYRGFVGTVVADSTANGGRRANAQKSISNAQVECFKSMAVLIYPLLSF